MSQPKEQPLNEYAGMAEQFLRDQAAIIKKYGGTAKLSGENYRSALDEATKTFETLSEKTKLDERHYWVVLHGSPVKALAYGCVYARYWRAHLRELGIFCPLAISEKQFHDLISDRIADLAQLAERRATAPSGQTPT